MTDKVFPELCVAYYLKEYLKDKKTPTCPFMQEPFDDCYCSSLNSRLVGQALFYCGEHYTQCATYENNIKQQ